MTSKTMHLGSEIIIETYEEIALGEDEGKKYEGFYVAIDGERYYPLDDSSFDNILAECKKHIESE